MHGIYFAIIVGPMGSSSFYVKLMILRLIISLRERDKDFSLPIRWPLVKSEVVQGERYIYM